MLQWFTRFPEFTEFSLQLGKTLMVLETQYKKQFKMYVTEYTNSQKHLFKACIFLLGQEIDRNTNWYDWWDWSTQYVLKINNKQECIPVGCILPALCRTQGSLSSGVSVKGSLAKVFSIRGSLSRGSLSRGVSVTETLLDGDEHGTRQPERKWHHTETPSPVNRMTDRQV